MTPENFYVVLAWTTKPPQNQFFSRACPRQQWANTEVVLKSANCRDESEPVTPAILDDIWTGLLAAHKVQLYPHNSVEEEPRIFGPKTAVIELLGSDK